MVRSRGTVMNAADFGGARDPEGNLDGEEPSTAAGSNRRGPAAITLARRVSLAKPWNSVVAIVGRAGWIFSREGGVSERRGMGLRALERWVEDAGWSQVQRD